MGDAMEEIGTSALQRSRARQVGQPREIAVVRPCRHNARDLARWDELGVVWRLVGECAGDVRVVTVTGERNACRAGVGFEVKGLQAPPP
ncbi:MAG: hypothetical protein M0Z63_04720 [Actinomycetota bacterium]|jgi:hypothetical protein|nr:hypothetical protein [Actinomycetota bacterium]